MGSVGQEVKRLREERGWRQLDLAYHSRLAQPTIHSIEKGQRNPSAKTLESLARAFDIDVGDLFPKADSPPLESEEGDNGGRTIRVEVTDGAAAVDHVHAQVLTHLFEGLLKELRAANCTKAAEKVERLRDEVLVA